MLIVVSYDIVNNSKRDRIVKVLQAYGTRVQKSVFECDLVDRERLNVYSKLTRIMKEYPHETDSIRFYKICASCLKLVEIIGAGEIQLRPQFIIV